MLISFILIWMSLQNVDKHLEILQTCCRFCAKKLGKGTRKTKCLISSEQHISGLRAKY